jgi:hypothetical protein
MTPDRCNENCVLSVLWELYSVGEARPAEAEAKTYRRTLTNKAQEAG